MGIFRSEQMGLYDLVIPKDSAWEIMNELGKYDCLHFNDSNADTQVFNLTFANTIKRCDEAQRRIKYIESECENYGISFSVPRDREHLMFVIDKMIRNNRKAASTLLEEYESDLHQKEKFLTEQTKKYDDMNQSINSLIEYKYVLSKSTEIIHQRNERRNSNLQQNDRIQRRSEVEEPLVARAFENEFNLSYIAGVINQDEAMRLQKLVFRATRGNALTIVEDLKKSLTHHDGKKTKKNIYVIIFKESSILRDKLNKICDSFLGERFDIPSTGISERIQDISRKINETRSLMDFTESEIRKYLESINKGTEQTDGISYLLIQKYFIRKEKTLYHTLNKLKLENSLFRGTAWCPLIKEHEVQGVITTLKHNINILGPQMTKIYNHDETPPTYFKQNEFTMAFQEIVSTYGTPTYGEVNPALFTIVTFPFLFGVMFGDIGHGFLLFLFASYMCLMKDRLIRQKSAIAVMLPARYLLLLMGFFATYNGFIYNDFVSMPLNLFGTCYDETKEVVNGNTFYVGRQRNDCVYPFGIDPKWYVSSNELTYMNSFKMKTAVILGVLQMVIGILLKAVNAIHFARPLDFFFVFVPQILFMVGIFGYMDFMIIYKWLTQWVHTSAAPSIITTLVNIPLKFGSVQGYPLWGDGSSQETLHMIILIVTLICLPVMLFPKPFILKHLHGRDSHGDEIVMHESATERRSEFPLDVHNTNEEESINKPGHILTHNQPLIPKKKAHGGHGEFNFGEEFIHQMIETIEFVLGSISNTASYLRLWALSLAHAQLADVFFSKTMKDYVHSGSIIGIFVGFFIFANFTFAVLMCMDVLECFLHTLRLHWVEFQGKFYDAKGYKFVPFSYQQVLSKDD